MSKSLLIRIFEKNKQKKLANLEYGGLVVKKG